MTQILQKDMFFAFVLKLLKEQTDFHEVPYDEQRSFILSVYMIFRDTTSLQDVYFQLISFFELEETLFSLILPLKSYFERYIDFHCSHDDIS